MTTGTALSVRGYFIYKIDIYVLQEIFKERIHFAAVNISTDKTSVTNSPTFHVEVHFLQNHSLPWGKNRGNNNDGDL